MERTNQTETRPDEADMITPPNIPDCDCHTCRQYRSMAEAVHGLIGLGNTVPQLIDLLKEEIREIRTRIERLESRRGGMAAEDDGAHDAQRSASSDG